jgi:hypothetical protein
LKSGFDDFIQIDRMKFEPQLAGSNARRIDQIVDQLSLRARAAFDGFERVSLRVFVNGFSG